MYKKLQQALFRITEDALQGNWDIERIRDEVRRILQKLGYAESLLSDLVSEIGTFSDSLSATTATAEERERLSTIVNTAGNQFAQTKRGLLRDVVDVVHEGIKNDTPIRDIRRGVDKKLSGKRFGQAETITQTALAAADRAGVYEDRDAEQLYRYDGPPADRPFCKTHLGKTYTLADLKALDNGQGLPVELYLGGFNCRHVLTPISVVNPLTPLPSPSPPYEMTVQRLDELEKKGWYIGNDKATIEQAFNLSAKGFDFDAFILNLETIAKDNRINIDSRTINTYGNKFTFELTGNTKIPPKNDGHFKISRDFYTDTQGKKVVYHDYLIIPTSLRNTDIAKQIFRDLVEQYINAGIDKIKVYAALSVGGYAWARYGFRCTNETKVRRIIDYSIIDQSEKDIALQVVDAHYNTNPGTPFPMDDLASLPFGKKLLLGETWDGELDLKDPVQLNKLKKYINYGK